MARRRASTGGADDYPEHLNPFRDGEEEDDDAEFEGAPLRRTGTLGRLRRRASLASTWSLRTLRRLAPQPPASHRASAPAPGLTPPPATAASPPPSARRRLRLPDLPWLSPRRRPRAASAPPAAPVIATTPRWPPTPSPTLSPSSLHSQGGFVLTPRTHRYRASPATPPEERARREALRLYGSQRSPPRSRTRSGDGAESEAAEGAVPTGPLAPLRIEEDPEQLRRAEMAAKQAVRSPAGRPPPGPRAPPRKRRAPLPPGPPPPATPPPPAATPAQSPLTPPGSPFSEDDDEGEEPEGGRPPAEDSSPEADQGEGLAPSPSPPPSSPPSSPSSPSSPSPPSPPSPTGTSVPASPRVPPRKPRRASAALATPPSSPLPSPPPSPLAVPLSSA